MTNIKICWYQSCNRTHRGLLDWTDEIVNALHYYTDLDPAQILLNIHVQVALLVYGLVVAISRVTDNKHHPTDVLAGAVLGSVTAAIALTRTTPDHSRYHQHVSSCKTVCICICYKTIFRRQYAQVKVHAQEDRKISQSSVIKDEKLWYAPLFCFIFNEAWLKITLERIKSLKIEKLLHIDILFIFITLELFPLIWLWDRKTYSSDVFDRAIARILFVLFWNDEIKSFQTNLNVHSIFTGINFV